MKTLIKDTAKEPLNKGQPNSNTGEDKLSIKDKKLMASPKSVRHEELSTGSMDIRPLTLEKQDTIYITHEKLCFISSRC